jgi:hypothetical protein
MSFLASLLDRFLDDHAFEELAVAVMQREGYSQIEPVGGSDDKGRDAQSRVFGGKSGERIILFQFSLQSTIRTKVRQTLDRLRQAKKSANTVIFVFSREISPTLKDQLVALALDEYAQDIELKDQRFLVSRLSQKSYRDITQQYFAKDLAELRALWDEDALFEDAAELQEKERRVLVNLVHYAQHPYSGDFKNELIRQTVDGVLSHESDPQPLSELVAEVLTFLPSSLNATVAEVEAEVATKVANGDLTKEKDGGLILPPAVKTLTELDIAAIALGRRNLYNQVLSQFKALGASAPSEHDIRVVVVHFFSVIFRNYGAEIANAILEKQNDELHTALGQEALAAAFSAVIPDTWTPLAGEMLRSAVGEVFNEPAAEVMSYLDRLSRSYVLMQLLNIDPDAINVQRSRMLDSIALLDTDVVLTALVSGNSRHATSRRIIELCGQLGIRCLAGSHELKEIVLRIERSINLFNQLGRPTVIPADKSDLITDFLLKVYYASLKAGTVQSFEEFIRKYYDPKAPQEHVRNLIAQDIGVEVVEISAFLLAHQDKKINKLQTTIEGARKMGNRFKHTDLYYADALQLVVVEQQNRDFMAKGRPGRWFLVSGDGYSFRAYLDHQYAFKVKPCVHPVHFLERLRHIPQAKADESTFGVILQSEAMLRGVGRNDFAPIMAGLSKVGVDALALPRARLLELVEDMDRADFTQWLYRVASEDEIDEKSREQIAGALNKLVAESKSRDDNVIALKELLQQARAKLPSPNRKS